MLIFLKKLIVAIYHFAEKKKLRKAIVNVRVNKEKLGKMIELE